MKTKHKVVKELERRGVRTKFFCASHNISLADFYSTTSGQRLSRKCVKVLYKENLLGILLDEFPNFKQKVEDMFI